MADRKLMLYESRAVCCVHLCTLRRRSYIIEQPRMKNSFNEPSLEQHYSSSSQQNSKALWDSIQLHPPKKVFWHQSGMNAAQTAVHENRQEGTSCITAAANITTEICRGFSSMLLEPLKKMNQQEFHRWAENFRNFNTSLPVGDIWTIHGWA